jgi:hypothetical protein
VAILSNKKTKFSLRRIDFFANCSLKREYEMEFPNFKGGSCGSSSSYDATNLVQIQTSFLVKMLLFVFMLFMNGEFLPNKNSTTFILDFEIYDLSANETSDFIANHPFLFVLIDRYIPTLCTFWVVFQTFENVFNVTSSTLER